MREVYLITVDDDIIINKQKGLGISKIAYTANPAIEVKGMAFNKQSLKQFYFQSEIEQKIAGPLMIPMDIYRIEDDGYEYDVRFTEETIAKIHETFMFNLNNTELFNDEHNNDKIVDSFITEIWIVEDPETDKAFTKFNIKVPKGTLFAVTKVPNIDVYNELVSEDKIGFSIQGMLGLSLQNFAKNAIKNTEHSDNKNKNQEIKMEENTLKLPMGEHTIGDKIYVVDEAGNIVEIKDVVAASTEPTIEPVTEEKKEEVAATEEPATEPTVEEKKETEMAEPTSITEEQVLAMIQPKLDEIYAMIAELKGQLETEEADEATEMPSNEQAFSVHKNFTAFQKHFKRH